MSEIVLRPDLSHCIRTMAKHEYERMQRKLLSDAGTDDLLAERLELLKSFLETTDFAELRSRYEPYLVEGKSVIFKLRSVAGGTEYEFEVA